MTLLMLMVGRVWYLAHLAKQLAMFRPHRWQATEIRFDGKGEIRRIEVWCPTCERRFYIWDRNGVGL